MPGAGFRYYLDRRKTLIRRSFSLGSLGVGSIWNSTSRGTT